MRIYKSFIFLLALLFISCGANKTAIIWTDLPEFALYGDYFNTAQNKYKVTVKYVESPSEILGNTDVYPDIVAGSWLKNSSTETYFKSLDSLFGAKKLSRNIFYSKILAIGRIGRDQRLIPVSFNLPALVFSNEKELNIANSFTIGFDEVKELGENYNVKTRDIYTRMGFSPLWNEKFLLTSATLSGASFMEDQPLSWDSAALERSMEFIYNWTHEINTSNQEEEEFTFKYFFEPPEKLIQSGRILFSYMESGDVFTLSEESKRNLDFRWIMEQDKIPVTEDTVFLGIHKKAKSVKAARAFILWLFRTENQRRLMEYCWANGLNESVFGICGGFSSLTHVTEQIFPQFYPELLGRMPSSDRLTPPNILPGNWAAIKERVILPYLSERARSKRADDIYSLEKRLSDWLRMNH